MTKSVLLLGSGFVAQPVVDILAADKNITVTVACRRLEAAKKLAGDKAKALSVDVENEKELDAAVAQHDLVISLIPYIYHVLVIKAAIRHKKNVVTTSYTSPQQLELEKQVKDAGIVVFNEIGLDPGVDHLYAVKVIDDVHARGGKIKTFLSYCGGLPAPEDSDNPLGYKFSWSPRGMLLALRNTAKFYQDGQVTEVPGEQLMLSAKPYYIYPAYSFVAYPNRDSTPYKERYNIPEADNIVRGTLRYQGFPEFVQCLADLGLLKEDKLDFLGQPLAWNEALAQLLRATSSSEADLEWAITSKHKFKTTNDKARVISGLKWLGLFSDTKIEPRGTPLDVLCATLESKMQLESGEKDMVMLQHKFEVEWADGKTETLTATLVENGDPNGYLAMTRLVGVPCAVAVKQVLNGTISEPGIHAPVTEKYAGPLRKQLEKEYGITMVEKVVA